MSTKLVRTLLGATAGRLLLACGPDASYAPPEEPLGVAESALTSVFVVQGSTLGSTSQHFDPGIFSVDPSSGAISRWCLASGTSWLKPNDDTPIACATQGGVVVSPDRTFTYLPDPEGVPFASIKNLGVDDARWQTARADVADSGVPATAPLKMIGTAVNLANLSTGLRWAFNASKLPPTIRYDIPGSGINIQIGQRLAQAQERTVFTAAGGGLKVDTTLNLILFGRSPSSGFSGITAAVNFVVPDTRGLRQPLTLLVTLFNPNGLQREWLGTDGRNPFVAGVLAPGTSYTTALANEQKTSAWGSPQLFSFEVSRTNMQKILADVNGLRGRQGLPLLSTDLTKVTFKEATIRNESRFIYDANVQVTFDFVSLGVSVLP